MVTLPHGSQVLIEAAVALRREGLSWEEALRLMAESELARLSGDDSAAWTAWMGLAPYAFADPLRARWRSDELDAARQSLAVFYATAITLWDLRMRAGLSERDLVRALGAALDGAVLDHRLNGDGFTVLPDVAPTPEGGRWTRWTLTARCILAGFTEPA